jgi:hypothetical protein
VIRLSLCHQLQGTTTPEPFGADMMLQVNGPTMLSVASTKAPEAAGTYSVGLCATGVSGASIVFNVVSGWIQLTN